MYILPVVRREMLVAARQGMIYRTRYWAGAIAGFGGIGALLWASYVWMFSSSPGEFLFLFTSALAFLFAFGAGLFLTVDVLSKEKREGTLGLLFLTELRGYDIVLGKLASAATKALSSFLTVIPILALAVCVGGVTGKQFWRTSIALFSLLVLSLCVGLLVSALIRKDGIGMSIFSGLMLLPTILGFVAASKQGAVPAWLLIVNPFYPVLAGLELFFGLAPPQMITPILSLPRDLYYTALFSNFVMAGACIVLASIILPWSAKAAPANVGIVRMWLRRRAHQRYTSTGPEPAGLHRHPAVWLAVRDKTAVFVIWLSLAGALVFYWFDPLAGIGASYQGLFYPLAVHYILKWQLAYESGKLITQERETGLLETLLTTPMNPGVLLRSKRYALRRFFFFPLLYVLLVHGLYIVKAVSYGPGHSGAGVAMLSVLILLTDFYSITWLGLWEGLRAGTSSKAFLRTLMFGFVVPWLPFIVLTGVFWFIFTSSFKPAPDLFLIWGYITAALVGLGIGFWGMARVHYQLRSRIAQLD